METEHINPWIQIWTQPRKTLRSILKHDPKGVIIWLAIISGALNTWLSFLWKTIPSWQEMPLVISVPLIIVIGGFFGWVSLYFGGWIYQLTGSWIGGKGTFTQVKCAVGWAQYPFIVAAIFNIFALFILPATYFQVLFGVLAFIGIIWGCIIFLKLIAEAHRFSFWKALLAALIALFLVFVAIMLVSLLVPLLSPLF